MKELTFARELGDLKEETKWRGDEGLGSEVTDYFTSPPRLQRARVAELVPSELGIAGASETGDQRPRRRAGTFCSQDSRWKLCPLRGQERRFKLPY